MNSSFTRFAGLILSLLPSLTLAAPKALQFEATVETSWNRIGTKLSHPALNGKPNLRMIVTQYSNTPSVAYNDHPIGLFYDNSAQVWVVANEDDGGMPLGNKFNVYIPSSKATVHAGAQNSIFDRTYFKFHRGKPAAFLFFSHLINPFPKFGRMYNEKYQGLYYSEPYLTPWTYNGCWSISNEDRSAAIATSYSVADASREANVFLLGTHATNILANQAIIDHPLANWNPNAVIFVSHVINPSGGRPARSHNHGVGVWYNDMTMTWSIFNQDGSTMPENVFFNVLIFPYPL